MKKFIKFIVRQLVAELDQVNVEETNNDKKTVEINIEVALNDIGKVVGKQGKNIIACTNFGNSCGGKK